MNKLDWAYKVLLNKRFTDPNNKEHYNEFGDTTLNIHLSQVWSDTVDSNPVVSEGIGVVKSYSFLTLTEDLSVPDHKCYFASDSETGNRLKDWVSDKYGQAYIVHLYDNNNNEIFPTDPCDWFFDYQTGILTFGSSISGFVRPFKLSGYRYTGRKGANTDDVESIIGDLSRLLTDEKEDIVSAINEIKAATASGSLIIKKEYNLLSVEQGELRAAWIEVENICYIKGIYLPGENMRLKLLTKPLIDGGRYVYDSGEATDLIWDVMTIPYVSESSGRIYLELENYGQSADFNLCIYIEKEL